LRISHKLAVVGLGYVGLPVAVAFARHTAVVGFDVNRHRIETLQLNHDWTGEVDESTLAMSALTFTADPEDLRSCDVYVVAVPTPVDEARTPDFSLLERACEMLGSVITPGAIIVFESTVHPGATEEICGAVLQRVSGMKAGVDFKLAYSPERINPGDKAHPLEKIVKIVSAQDAETLGSGLIDQSQKMTAAAMEMADMKV